MWSATDDLRLLWIDRCTCAIETVLSVSCINYSEIFLYFHSTHLKFWDRQLQEVSVVKTSSWYYAFTLDLLLLQCHCPKRCTTHLLPILHCLWPIMILCSKFPLVSEIYTLMRGRFLNAEDEFCYHYYCVADPFGLQCYVLTPVCNM
jgi:hypothetical protein